MKDNRKLTEKGLKDNKGDARVNVEHWKVEKSLGMVDAFLPQLKIDNIS